MFMHSCVSLVCTVNTNMSYAFTLPVFQRIIKQTIRFYLQFRLFQVYLTVLYCTTNQLIPIYLGVFTNSLNKATVVDPTRVPQHEQ